MSDERFRPVNQMLGARPGLGPIPADLALPWGGIVILVLIFTRSVFVLDWMWTIGLIVWGCTTWAVLTGTKPHKFLSKFMSPPRRWSRGHGRYKPMSVRSDRPRRQRR
jgi:hypothetical protein